MKLLRISFLICCFFACLLSFDAMAAAKKSEPAEPKEVIVDFNPFVVSNIIEGKIIYTVDVSIRILVNDTAKPEITEKIGKIRDSLLMLLRKNIQFEKKYENVNINSIKTEFSNYFKQNFPDDFKKLYILKFQIK